MRGSTKDVPHCGYFEVDVDRLEAGAPWRSVALAIDVWAMLDEEGELGARQQGWLKACEQNGISGSTLLSCCASAPWVRRLDERVAAGELVKTVEPDGTFRDDDVLVYRRSDAPVTQTAGNRPF